MLTTYAVHRRTLLLIKINGYKTVIQIAKYLILHINGQYIIRVGYINYIGDYSVNHILIIKSIVQERAPSEQQCMMG
jgi:hypothetical protein